MECRDARLHLLDHHEGRLDAALDADVRAHLEGCAVCARAEVAEHTLTELLERRLPQHPASLGLKRRLAAQWPASPTPRVPWWGRRGRFLVPAFAVAIVLLVATPLAYYQLAVLAPRQGAALLITEAVNDHVRVLTSQHPLEIESTGMHEVKPWFAGRLDFAPVVPFAGDADFPLRGGAVGYFVDRKAAVFVYNRRLHPISLFVFRADGFSWPTRGLERVGKVEALATTARGFNAILWRRAELGYALVSDLDAGELRELAAKLSGVT